MRLENIKKTEVAMDLTIINSINNNTYANNLHIQNTHPKRILHLLKQIAKLVDKTLTDNEPYIAVNNIIKTAYEKYNNRFDYLETYGNHTVVLEIDWYFDNDNTLNTEKTTITGLDSLLCSIKSTENFDIIISELETHTGSRIQIERISYDLKKIPMKAFHNVHRYFVNAGIYIYNDIVRCSYVTVLYDKINSIIYFDKKPN